MYIAGVGAALTFIITPSHKNTPSASLLQDPPPSSPLPPPPIPAWPTFPILPKHLTIGEKRLLSPTFPYRPETWQGPNWNLKQSYMIYQSPQICSFNSRYGGQKRVRLTKRCLPETLRAISWQFLSFPQTGPHHRHITSPDRLFVLDRLRQDGRSAKFDRKFPPGLAGLFVPFVAGTSG